MHDVIIIFHNTNTENLGITNQIHLDRIYGITSHDEIWHNIGEELMFYSNF